MQHHTGRAEKRDAAFFCVTAQRHLLVTHFKPLSNSNRSYIRGIRFAILQLKQLDFLQLGTWRRELIEDGNCCVN